MASETLRPQIFSPSSIPGGDVVAAARRDMAAAVDMLARLVHGDAGLRIRADAIDKTAIDGPTRACVLLPAHVALVQRFTIPRAGAKHLAGIVQNKIRQLTPFEPEDVYVGWRRAPGRGDELPIDLVVAPAKSCENVLSAARARDLFVDRLEAEGAPGVDILPASERQKAPAERRARRLMRVNLVLLAILGLITFGGGAARYGLASLKASSAEARAGEVVSARREAQRIAAGAADLQAIAAGAPDIAGLLNALAGALNDDAYLERVRVDRQNVLLQGYADNAADVLFAVDKSPQFSRATFKSAIARDKGTGKERFQISAELERAP